jgi:5-(carboxyamino)imidazole ribonucleotide synthase
MTHAPSRRWLGVLGGGQLGRMFVHAAQSMGFAVLVLEPDAASPAGAAADRHLCAPYVDAAALAEMATTCEAVTTEFENVPAAALQMLADAGCRVAPGAAAVLACQHRVREKQTFVDCGVPCAPFAVIEEGVDLADPALAALLPGILKTSSLGYDGQGQVAVPDVESLDGSWSALGRKPCVLEKRLPLAAELSVIVARGGDGRTVSLPPARNVHRDGILALTQVPAQLDSRVEQAALGHASRLAEQLGYVGVLCVEFFVLDDGSLVANEMAPRPHNSGHASIDACDGSQFDLQVRTLAGWPLAPPRLHSPAVMLNLLGDLWFVPDGSLREPDWAPVLALPGAHLHLYGKHEPRRARKMGHVTFTASDAATAHRHAAQAARLIGLDLGLDPANFAVDA